MLHEYLVMSLGIGICGRQESHQRQLHIPRINPCRFCRYWVKGFEIKAHYTLPWDSHIIPLKWSRQWWFTFPLQRHAIPSFISATILLTNSCSKLYWQPCMLRVPLVTLSSSSYEPSGCADNSFWASNEVGKYVNGYVHRGNYISYFIRPDPP